MNPIHQNLTNYFITTCRQNEYEFLENTEKTTISIFLKDNAEENPSWHKCDIPYAVNVIVENCLKLNTIEVRLNRVGDNLFENIWLQCKNKEEKSECINLFKDRLISNDYQFIKSLSSFSNEEYMNILLEHFYTKEKNSSRNDPSLESLIEFFNYSKMHLTLENLTLACKDNKSSLAKLPIQNLLKDFVEQHFPNNIEDFRTYWKKIDTDLVVGQEVVTVCPCVSIGFNKKFIYSLNLGQPVDFYERKLKAINTFMNKAKFKKEYPIERSVFDGLQDSQNEYRFIVFGDKPELNLKEFLTDFINKIISIDDEATPQILNSALNYIRISQKTEKVYPIKNKIKI